MADESLGDAAKSERQDKQADHAGEAPEQKLRDAESAPPITPENGGLASTPTREATEANQSSAENSKTNRTVADSTKTIALLTGGLVVVGLLSVFASLFQWMAIRDQLDIMRSEQRAWLTLDMELAGSKQSIKKNVFLALNFNIENIGKLPALNIGFLYMYYYGYGIFTPVKNVCRAADLDVEFRTGATVFPGRKYARPPQRIASGEDDHAEFGRDMWIIACISYDMNGRHDRGHTGVSKRVAIVQMENSPDAELSAIVRTTPAAMWFGQQTD